MLSIWILVVFLGNINGVNAGTSLLFNRIQRNSHPLPRVVGRGPLPVKIGMYIESLGKFKSTEMSFDADLYLYMNWKDPLLSHNESDHVLINSPKVREHIWMPDLYLSNSRSSKYHDVTVPNFSMFVARDGTVAYSGRITITVACNLDLVNYPMDRQNCQIRTLSYAYIASKVNISWFSIEPIRFNPEISLPEFRIQSIKPTYCNGEYRYAIMDKQYKQAQFSCLEVDIFLRRAIGYHIVQSFLPSGLIVCISWVSFWIDRAAVPARVTLSFTTLLSLSTLGNGLRIGLPQVSYVKALDLWFGVCMFFVFTNLLEFALVNSYMQKAEKYKDPNRMNGKDKNRKMKDFKRHDTNDENKPLMSPQHSHHTHAPHTHHSVNGCHNPLASLFSFHKAFENSGFFMPLDECSTTKHNNNNNTSKDHSKHNSSGHNHSSCCDYSRKALQVDKISRIIFPLAFLIFNIVYWGYYLWYAEIDDEQNA